MAVEERQLDFRQHQSGLARQCFHKSVSAIERFNNLTPDLFQQLPVQRTCVPVGFNKQDSTGDSAVVEVQRSYRYIWPV